MSTKDLDNDTAVRLDKIYHALMHDNSSLSIIRTTLTPPPPHNISTVFPTNSTLSPIFNSTTTASPAKSNISLTIGTAVCAGILILIFISCGIVCFCKWFKRRLELKRDLTPYYSYDQSEADVADGILYSTETNSADMLCVVADNLVSPDNEISFAHTNYFSNSDDKLLHTNEMGTVGSVSV